MNEFIIRFSVSIQGLMIISYLGMLSHFLKKKITGETLADITQYFILNFKSTLIAWISTTVISIGTYMTLSTGQPIDIIAFFGIGYTFDSSFNKFKTS